MTEVLLIRGPSIPVSVELAKSIGLNEAIVLQQIHYWTEQNGKADRNGRDGYYWAYNSYREWQKQFPWWSERTIKRIFTALERRGLLISGSYNRLKMDRTKWYRVNYDTLRSMLPLGQVDTMDGDSLTQPVPEINIKTRIMGKMDTMDCSATKRVGDDVVNPTASKVGSAIPKVKHSDSEISGFIEWYFALYEKIEEHMHPPIKSRQLVRVHDVLKGFCDENEVDIEGLKDMADNFFYVAASDHNINHFATAGILENRFYETLF